MEELAEVMPRLTIGDLAVDVMQGGTHEFKDLVEAVTAFRDVSCERTALEPVRERTNEELRRHRKELRELVSERTAQLEHEVTSYTAKRASRSRSDFLATMSPVTSRLAWCCGGPV